MIPDDPGDQQPFMNPHKMRVLRVLGRHARKEDMGKTDMEFVERLIERWRAHLAQPLVDVNE